MLGWVLIAGDGRTLAQSSATVRDYGVRLWTKADGLPDASVTAILQTKDSYLWVGTSSGLVRFDGVTFTELPLRPSGASAPVSITTLREDGAQRLWIGTEQYGLFCLVRGQLLRYERDSGLADEWVTSLTVDAHNDLWVGTRRGVNRWNGSSFATFTTKDGLPDDFVSGVRAARSGAVWITTRAGMCSFSNGRISPIDFQATQPGRNPEFLDAYEDQGGNLWAFGATYLINLTEGKRFNYFHGDEPPSVRIWSLCEGRDGRLWIGTSGRGLFWFDGGKFQPVTLSEGHWPNDVRAICEDSEGNLWLGIAEGGLARLHPQNYVLIKPSQGIPAGAAACLAVDALGRVNAGLRTGGLFVNLGQRFETFSDRIGGVGQEVASSLCTGSEGTLWVATIGSGLYRIKGGRATHFSTANGLADNCVLSVCSAPDGTTWVGTRCGTLHRFHTEKLVTYDEADGLPGASITALLPRAEGGLWVGTSTGLFVQAPNGGFNRVRVAHGLSDKPILALSSDSLGGLWLGTAGGGLGCVTSQASYAWTTSEGLPDDSVFGIVDEPGGDLWLLTGKGICQVNTKHLSNPLGEQLALKSRMVFETTAGFNGEAAFGGPRALRTIEGLLWFASDDGLVVVNARESKAETLKLPVYVEAVAANSQRLPLTAPEKTDSSRPSQPTLSLPTNLRALEIQFTALNLSTPEKVRFRHKLEGLDTDWVDGGPERRVRYGRLLGGHYVFRVSARVADGDWSEPGASLAFVVKTPWWRSEGMLVVYAMAAVAIIGGTVRVVSHRRLRRRLMRLEQQQAMERERMRIAQDMHDEIGSKLTKISFLSELAKVEQQETGAASAKIDSIAHTSRELLKALDEIVWAVNPRNDTLEILAAYLGEYAREYFQNTSVDCEMRIQSELTHEPMSAETRHNLFLAFEECLNNVLKHSGASKVQVEITADPGRVQIRVSDNGRGFDLEATEAVSSVAGGGTGTGGNGLHNIRQRLMEISGNCSMQSKPGIGTTVNLSLPLQSLKLQPA